MNTLFVGDNAVLQTEQDGATFVVMGANATVVSVGSDVIFAGTGHSTIYDTGIHATSAGYQGSAALAPPCTAAAAPRTSSTAPRLAPS